MFTWFNRKAFVVLVAAFAGLGALGFAITVVGQVECPPGCVRVRTGCVSPSLYREYSERVASELYQDPSGDPDKVRDVRRYLYRVDRTGCQACPCTYVACNHPCAGTPTGGVPQPKEYNYWTTQCVDKTLGGGNSLDDDPF